MYKVCQSERSARRQRYLEQGLLQLMQKKHYDDISVCDLCEYMSIPRKSFYRYFSGKDGALFALLDHTLAEFFENPQVGDRLTGGTALGDLDLFFQFWHQRKSFLDAISNSSLSGILIERAHAFALREGHLPNQIKHYPEDIRGIAMAFSISGLMAMILQWHQQGFQLSAEKMIQLAAAILTKPLIQA